MGWWSTDIMGGDTPLDWECLFFDSLGIEMFPPGKEPNKITKEHFENESDKLINAINDESESDIAHQVLAVLWMRTGAKIPDEIKNKMIAACDNDEWAKEDDERKASVENLKTQLMSYGEDPVNVKSKGLFQVIGESIAEGKTGLVNIIPPND